ncbi:MAG TPA: tRNA (N(6)-L-threonylcarbamoyladenosine(37)-C(2))-methylthiotransferase [Thermoplasmataceae archaeon]|nr:tRNA (N(6)-L-threonylcarbamoyladenosine(37)-C(2))-methylthiotransferase [Thermoplasmatales archaeon AK]HLH85718.1 tRNA (N(6)-L-threonylcarbamoyladenosine(37)-C(2))-methylthiotransferase [Thermoplasmataceae archaeon]
MKYYLESYGCTLSKSEAGLYLNSLLTDQDTVVSAPEQADLRIIGTCVVVKHTENKMIRRIQELSSSGKVRVIGCLPPVSGNSLETENIETLKPQEFRNFYRGSFDSIEIREPGVFDGIPINQGCTGSCNFCISRVARGKLLSRSPDKIEQQVKMQLARGIKEVRLTSLDTAAYGKDIGENLANLVRRVSSIDGDFRVRVGMMEPANTSAILNELIASYSAHKVFKFLHLPVQSGSDRILELMNRGYQSSAFSDIVHAFRTAFGDMTVSTDIICGYPGETQDDFNETVELIQRTRPEIINITRFSPRPFTPDFNRKPPSSNDVKEWSAKLSALHKEILREALEGQVNTVKIVLITENGKQGTVVGRDSAYRPVVIPGEFQKYSFVECEIVDAGETYLIGKPV